MEFFIALTFQESDLHCQKINSYRSRYDYKKSRSPHLLMSLLPPFSMGDKSLTPLQMSELVECLRDDLDNFFTGHEDNYLIHFDGFDFNIGKKGVVYLKPRLPEELFFFKEMSISYLKEFGMNFKREEKNLKNNNESEYIFLPIARTSDQDLLGHAVSKAQSEFSRPFTLQAKEVALFEKQPGQWVCRSILHHFNQEDEKSFTPELVLS